MHFRHGTFAATPLLGVEFSMSRMFKILPEAEIFVGIPSVLGS